MNTAIPKDQLNWGKSTTSHKKIGLFSEAKPWLQPICVHILLEPNHRDPANTTFFSLLLWSTVWWGIQYY